MSQQQCDILILNNFYTSTCVSICVQKSMQLYVYMYTVYVLLLPLLSQIPTGYSSGPGAVIASTAGGKWVSLCLAKTNCHRKQVTSPFYKSFQSQNLTTHQPATRSTCMLLCRVAINQLQIREDSMSLSTVQRQQADLNTSHYCSQQGTLTLFRRSKYDAVHARNSWNFPVLRNGQVHMGLSFLAYMPLTPLTVA